MYKVLLFTQCERDHGTDKELVYFLRETGSNCGPQSRAYILTLGV